MKTKLQFRVYDRVRKRYLSGYEEATKHFLGIANDYKDKTLLCIAFDDGEPDTYYNIEYVPQNICKTCSQECIWYSKTFQDCDNCTKRKIGKVQRGK